jgi:hypothetical protein
MWPQDILINKLLTSEQIITTVGQLFSIAPADVMVVTDIFAAPGGNFKVLCEIWSARGDFVMGLSIYPHLQLQTMASQSWVQRFAEVLNVLCLISDGTDNPYTRLLIAKGLSARHVLLDAAQLDHSSTPAFCMSRSR